MFKAPAIPVDHPGIYIGDEIAARGWNQRDLAYILDVSERAVGQIISGKGGISANMAKALAMAFDVSPDLFLSLQKQYDLWQAEDPEEAVNKRARVMAKYPLREMMRRGWIQDERDPGLMELQLCQFFGVGQFDDVPHMRYSAKRTHYDDVPSQQLAWLFRIRHISEEMIVPTYSELRLRSAVTQMSEMRMAPNEIRHVPGLLQDAGVRFVIVEGLAGGKIDGVCFWLSDQPVIGMTVRFDRIDNFWFVLRHEIEHVLRQDGQSEEIIDTDNELDPNNTDLSEEEIRANLAAADFCVPIEEMDSFFHRKNPYFSRRDVEDFALRMGVHPGIVVGQIHRRSGNYTLLRDRLVKIRHHLSDSAVIDGWGDVVPTGD